MEKKRMLCRIFPVLFAFSLLFASVLAEQPQPDAAGDLNDVTASMDISEGIPVDASGVLARIREKGVLRVATDADWPPQEFIDPSLEGQARFVGADMDLARLIAERMGVELEIIKMDFSEVLPSLSSGDSDLAVSALAFSPARASAYTMSRGYYYAETPTRTVMVIRAADAGSITSVEALAGRTLIAQRGSVQEAMATAHIKKYREFRRVSDTDVIFDAVARGRADAGAMEEEAARDYLEKNPECELAIAKGIEFALEEEYQGDRIAARKGEDQLIRFVNGVIDEVLANHLYDQWIAEARERAGKLGLGGN